MSWYSTGTVSVTNGSPTVTGSGTSWVGTIDAGWGLVAPDGKVYEVLSVGSATQITLAKNYAGSNASGQPYSLFPTQGLVRALTTQVLQLINDYAAVATGAGAGKFSAGTAALPGVAATTDLDTGIAWLAANVLGISTGGLERVRFDGSGRIGQRVSAPEYYYDIRAINFGASQAPQGVALRGTASADLSGAGWLGGLFMESNGSGQNSLSIYGPNATTAGANTMQKAIEVFGSGATQDVNIYAGGALFAKFDNTRVLTINSSTPFSGGSGVAPGLQLQGTDFSSGIIASYNFVSDNTAPGLYLVKSRGGSVAATHGAVQSGDNLGSLRFAGSDGTNVIPAAQITGIVDGTPGTGDMPGRLVFSTTADGSASITERMRIDSAGRVGIGTVAPSTALHVAGDATLETNESSAASGMFLVNPSSNASAGARVSWSINGAERAYMAAQLGVGTTPSLQVGVNGAEALRLDATRRLLVGSTASRTILGVNAQVQVESANSTSASSLMLFANRDDNFAATLTLGKSRGTAIGALDAVADGDTLGSIRFVGADGAVDRIGAQIASEVDGTPGSGDMPTRLVFSTTADGNSSPTERMRIDNGGNVIMTAPVTPPTLTVNRQMVFNLTSSTNLRISVRGADGVTRTANITLS